MHVIKIKKGNWKISASEAEGKSRVKRFLEPNKKMPKKEIIVTYVPWYQEAKKDLWLGHRMQQGDIVMTFANRG